LRVTLMIGIGVAVYGLAPRSCHPDGRRSSSVPSPALLACRASRIDPAAVLRES
jgi:hypothetical protein